MSGHYDDDDDRDARLARLGDRALQTVTLVLGILLATPFVLILTAPFIG